VTARARRLAALALGLVGAACSTLAEVTPPDGCTVDDDSDPGYVCGAGLCYESVLPARDLIGLDVFGTGLGSTFRVEILGDDAAVLRINRSPIRYSISLDNRTEAPGIRDQLRLTLVEARASADTNVEFNIPASMSLSQQSRLGREAVRSSVRRYLTDETGQPLARDDVSVKWARYDRDPLGQDIPLLLQVTPDDGPDPITTVDVRRGPVYRQLVRAQLEEGAGEHAFEIRTRQECHRRINGTVLVGEAMVPGAPIDVEFRHAGRDPELGPICEEMPASGTEAVCSPQTITPGDLPECITVNDCPAPYGCHPVGDESAKRCGCTSDDQCPLGQVCELESKRCALDLSNLVATRGGTSTTPESPGTYEAWIYTYCDGALEDDREMDFIVTATPRSPDPDMGVPPQLPTLRYRSAIDFPWGNGMRPPADAKALCMPDWAAPQLLTMATLSSAPRELYRVDEAAKPWVCCSPACLVDAEKGEPPPAPTSCPLGAVVTAYTVFTPDPAAWTLANCMALEQTPPLPAGSQRVTYGPFDRNSCGQLEASCEIPVSRGEGSREYEIRLEPPVGSLVRSTILPPQTVTDGTEEIVAPPLEYRVLLRGRVELPAPSAGETDTDTDGEPLCDGICQIDAEVMAERLRLPGEDAASVPGPYFYTGQTISGSLGKFVLAVNPGVYLLTALPKAGALGGPAKIRVVDLRLESNLVDTSGPMPIADLSNQPIVLDPGSLVTIELDGFDRNSTAIPLDMAGWKGQIDGYPDLDLNAPTTCHGAADRGCQIRRLRPGQSGLSPTQEQFVKYLTRTPPE
jgi:hypothetical protein